MKLPIPILILSALALAATARGQEPPPSPSPSPSPRPRTVSETVEPVVDRMMREPCGPASAAGVPCFPLDVEIEEPEYSVAKDLEAFVQQERRPNRPQRLNLSPYGTPIVGVSFDAVCAGKSLLKAVRGRNDTYYLYRVWDGAGERAVLRDRPFDPAATAGIQYESLGKISGECDAVAAWRKANREARARNQGPAKPN